MSTVPTTSAGPSTPPGAARSPGGRPVEEDEANKPAYVKLWKDIKWKVQPEAYQVRKLMMKALERTVDASEAPHINEHNHKETKSWLADLFDAETLDKLLSHEHFGNFVIIRATGIKDFEEMPIYARVGMHLLFYGSAQVRLLRWDAVRNLLKEQSVRQGAVYDKEGPEVIHKIQSFIKTYEIDMKEVLVENLHEYKTFNQFFARKLKPTARPIDAPDDASVIVSAADSRLNVFHDFAQARQFWVKGKRFTVPELLGSSDKARLFGENPALSIFRLAPQDYHRFHSPVTGTIESITTLPGNYYTVNPQAVNESLDVLTGNRREVCYMQVAIGAQGKTVPVAVVAVGALLVGSVHWSHKVGEVARKGEDLGWFQYGGSTVIVVYPEEANVTWDDDLRRAATGEWTGTEDPEVMARIPAHAKIGPTNKRDTFGIEVVVRAAEKIGVFAPRTAEASTAASTSANPAPPTQ